MADQAVNDSPGHHIIGDGCTWVSETARVSSRSGQDVQSGVQSAADMANIAVRRNDRRSLARSRSRAAGKLTVNKRVASGRRSLINHRLTPHASGTVGRSSVGGRRRPTGRVHVLLTGPTHSNETEQY